MTAPLTHCARCASPHATIDVMGEGVKSAFCQACYERLTMPAFVKIDSTVFVAQDTRDILLAEIARLTKRVAELEAQKPEVIGKITWREIDDTAQGQGAQ